MSEKSALPLFGDIAARAQVERDKPTLEQARQRLGGPAGQASPDGPATGDVVDFVTKEGPASGVVLYADDKALRVLVDAVRVRHLPPRAATPHRGDAPEELKQLAADARIFAGLALKQTVRFHDGATMQTGTLVEKCVYGALVAKESGAILAVGFRKLWPLPDPASS